MSRSNDPLALVPFNTMPPSLPQALKAVYGAFSDYRIAYPLCPTCFGPTGEAAMRAARPVTRAPYEAFRQIYFEHPGCSGGVETFKHWLPRALELGGFDMGVYFDRPLSEQMARLGLLDWPGTEQAALRDIFSRAAVDWFERGETALGVVNYKTDGPQALFDGEGIISAILVNSLAVLRVEPESLARWLLTMTGDPQRADKVWRGLAEGLWLEHFVDPQSYLALPEGQDEADYRQRLDKLRRSFQEGYVTLLRPLDLVAAMDGAEPKTAKLISDIADELDYWDQANG